MSGKCSTCGVKGHYSKNCRTHPCAICGIGGHVGSNCPIRIARAKEAYKEANKISNMAPEQVARQNGSHRIDNMAPEQVAILGSLLPVKYEILQDKTLFSTQRVN